MEFDETQDRLFYEFTLVDQPQVDMELPVYVGKPLDQVVDQLKESMGNLAIVITNEQGVSSVRDDDGEWQTRYTHNIKYGFGMVQKYKW